MCVCVREREGVCARARERERERDLGARLMKLFMLAAAVLRRSSFDAHVSHLLSALGFLVCSDAGVLYGLEGAPLKAETGSSFAGCMVHVWRRCTHTQAEEAGGAGTGSSRRIGGGCI